MDLIKHVRNFLSENPSVIIPGLGRFVAVDKPAEIQGAIVIPPYRTIQFDITEDVDDGKLEIYIAQLENVDKEQVKEELDDFYNKQIKHKLASGKNVALSGLGILSVDKLGNILFEPDNDLRIDRKDTFGLDPIDLSGTGAAQPVVEKKVAEVSAVPVEKVEPVKQAESVKQDTESLFDTQKMRVRENTERRAQPAVEKQEPPVNPAKTVAKPTPKPVQKKKTNTSSTVFPVWLVVVLLGTAALGVGFYFLYPVLMGSGSQSSVAVATLPKDNVEPEKTKIPDEIVPVEPSKQSSQPSQTTQPKTTAQSTKNSQSSQASSSVRAGSVGQGRYLLIVGSFNTTVRAERYGKFLEQSGINYEVIDFGGGRVRVAVESTDDIHDAYNRLNRIKKQPYCSGVWVLKR